MQVFHNGREATPKSLTETDLVDIEEKLLEKSKQRSESLWNALVEEVGKRRFTSVFESDFDPSAYFKIPDMDDITTEVSTRVLRTFD